MKQLVLWANVLVSALLLASCLELPTEVSQPPPRDFRAIGFTTAGMGIRVEDTEMYYIRVAGIEMPSDLSRSVGVRVEFGGRVLYAINGRHHCHAIALSWIRRLDGQ